MLTLGESTCALLSDCDAESGEQVLVLCLVDLQPTLDEIEWHNERVSRSAAQDTAETAQREVVSRAEFACFSRIDSGRCNCSRLNETLIG